MWQSTCFLKKKNTGRAERKIETVAVSFDETLNDQVSGRKGDYQHTFRNPHSSMRTSHLYHNMFYCVLLWHLEKQFCTWSSLGPLSVSLYVMTSRQNNFVKKAASRGFVALRKADDLLRKSDYRIFPIIRRTIKGGSFFKFISYIRHTKL